MRTHGEVRKNEVDYFHRNNSPKLMWTYTRIANHRGTEETASKGAVHTGPEPVADPREEGPLRGSTGAKKKNTKNLNLAG